MLLSLESFRVLQNALVFFRVLQSIPLFQSAVECSGCSNSHKIILGHLNISKYTAHVVADPGYNIAAAIKSKRGSFTMMLAHPVVA